MENYVYNTTSWDIQNQGDGMHEEENKRSHRTNDEATARNQMRGFELIHKVF